MYWIAAVALAQLLECGIESEARLPPGGDFRPVILKRQKAARGFETWRAGNVELTRRIGDGAFGVLIERRVVDLKPMGLLGVEGIAKVFSGENGFEYVPKAVRVFRNQVGWGAAEVTVQVSGSAYAAARCGNRLAMVDIAGRGPQGVDVNGDGKIEVNSPAEYARVKGGVFEIEGKGYTIEAVDWQRRVVLMREAPLGPQMKVGDVIPDVTYVDRLKERRTLSSHGAAFTVVDYWASWCGPCIAAFPQLKALAETYDLKVLGLNGDEDAGAASKVLAQFEVLWPDVQGTEPAWLYDSRLRVGLYPTYVLLDASRRVVARTESTIELIEEVKRLVPRRKAP
ncbi:MAG: TlpA family protein disulfide reductase [Acidobacteria bacterium]|nr:TlpA family protein disulfide reductase [Acidobacteriota bacterium]